MATAVLDANKTNQIVTRQELKDLLATQKGATMVTIISHTDPATRKGDKGKVVKQSTTNGVINWNYEGSVNRQQKREGGEGTFQAKPRKWGQKIEGTCLIEHKGNYYLELKVERALKAEYFERRPDGSLVATTKEAIAAILPKKRSSAPSQGVNKEIILRDYKLTNIVILRMGGKEYHIVD